MKKLIPSLIILLVCCFAFLYLVNSGTTSATVYFQKENCRLNMGESRLLGVNFFDDGFVFAGKTKIERAEKYNAWYVSCVLNDNAGVSLNVNSDKNILESGKYDVTSGSYYQHEVVEGGVRSVVKRLGKSSLDISEALDPNVNSVVGVATVKISGTNMRKD